MRFLAHHRERFHDRMTAAAMEVLADIRSDWLLAETFWGGEPDRFDSRLGALVRAMTSANPNGGLSHITIAQVRHRLHIALVTALLRIVPKPSKFYTQFGTVPNVLADMRQDRARLCQAMAFFWRETPYADLVASQAFWRTLQTLDLEVGRQSGQTLSMGG